MSTRRIQKNILLVVRMKKTNLFRIAIIVVLLGILLYQFITNTHNLFLQITQTVLFFSLWLVIAIDQYQQNHSKKYLVRHLIFIGVSILILITVLLAFK